MRIASFFRLRVFQRDPVSEEKVSTHVLYIPYHTLRYDTELLIFSLILIIIVICYCGNLLRMLTVIFSVHGLPLDHDSNNVS